MSQGSIWVSEDLPVSNFITPAPTNQKIVLGSLSHRSSSVLWATPGFSDSHWDKLGSVPREKVISRSQSIHSSLEDVQFSLFPRASPFLGSLSPKQWEIPLCSEVLASLFSFLPICLQNSANVLRETPAMCFPSGSYSITPCPAKSPAGFSGPGSSAPSGWGQVPAGTAGEPHSLL